MSSPKSRHRIYNTSLAGRYRNLKRRAAKFSTTPPMPIEIFAALSKLPCYFCRRHFRRGCGSGLDRLSSSKGYTVSNTVACCHVCNRIKSDILTPAETQRVVALLGPATLRRIRKRLLRQYSK